MATVSQLVVDMKLESAAFTREMRAMRAETKTFHSSIAGMAKSASAAFAGLLTIGAVTGVLRAVARETIEAEKSQARLEGVIRATGMAANLTAEQVGRMADRLEGSTLFDAEEIQDAAAKLLTFKSIVGDTFRRTLEAATDLSAGGFGSVESAAVQLGKALEDPVRGMSALREAGVTFTASEEKKIKALVEGGRQLKAQEILLEAVEGQVGNVAEAMRRPGGLTDSVKSLSDEWKGLLEDMGRTSQTGTTVIPVLEKLRDIVQEFRTDPESRMAVVERRLNALVAQPEFMRLSPAWRAEMKQLREAHKTLWQELYGAPQGTVRMDPVVVGRPTPRPAPGKSKADEDREETLAKLIQGYRDEAFALQFGNEALEIRRLRLLGATEAEVDVYRALQNEIAAVDESKTAWDAWATLVSADARAATAAILAEHERIRESTRAMLDELDDLQREMADETAGHWQHAAAEAQHAMKDFYKTLLLDGRAAFGDLLASWADTLAEMAAMQAAKATGNFLLNTVLGFGGFMGGFSSNASSSLSPLTQPMTGPVSGPGGGAGSPAMGTQPNVTIELTANFNVSAIDSRSVEQFFNQNGGLVVQELVKGIRRSRGVAQQIGAGLQ